MFSSRATFTNASYFHWVVVLETFDVNRVASHSKRSGNISVTPTAAPALAVAGEAETDYSLYEHREASELDIPARSTADCRPLRGEAHHCVATAAFWDGTAWKIKYRKKPFRSSSETLGSPTMSAGEGMPAKPEEVERLGRDGPSDRKLKYIESAFWPDAAAHYDVTVWHAFNGPHVFFKLCVGLSLDAIVQSNIEKVKMSASAEGAVVPKKFYYANAQDGVRVSQKKDTSDANNLRWKYVLEITEPKLVPTAGQLTFLYLFSVPRSANSVVIEMKVAATVKDKPIKPLTRTLLFDELRDVPKTPETHDVTVAIIPLGNTGVGKTCALSALIKLLGCGVPRNWYVGARDTTLDLMAETFPRASFDLDAVVPRPSKQFRAALEKVRHFSFLDTAGRELQQTDQLSQAFLAALASGLVPGTGLFGNTRDEYIEKYRAKYYRDPESDFVHWTEVASSHSHAGFAADSALVIVPSNYFVKRKTLAISSDTDTTDTEDRGAFSASADSLARSGSQTSTAPQTWVQWFTSALLLRAATPPPSTPPPTATVSTTTTPPPATATTPPQPAVDELIVDEEVAKAIADTYKWMCTYMRRGVPSVLVTGLDRLGVLSDADTERTLASRVKSCLATRGIPPESISVIGFAPAFANNPASVDFAYRAPYTDTSLRVLQDVMLHMVNERIK